MPPLAFAEVLCEQETLSSRGTSTAPGEQRRLDFRAAPHQGPAASKLGPASPHPQDRQRHSSEGAHRAHNSGA